MQHLLQQMQALAQFQEVQMFDEETTALAEMTIREFGAANMTVTTAESCTGGLIAAALTSVAGSSEVFERGMVTYANSAKQQMLGVEEDTLNEHGAVSAECAVQMATGALRAADAGAAVAVTGIAGPGGGTPEKPVGLVFIAVATHEEEGAFVERFEFGELGRDKIRHASVREALEMLLGYALDSDEPDPATH